MLDMQEVTGSSPAFSTKKSAVTPRTSKPNNGGLAQLVRAPASHAGGHWFESSILHHEITDSPTGYPLFQSVSQKENAGLEDERSGAPTGRFARAQMITFPIASEPKRRGSTLGKMKISILHHEKRVLSR